MFSFRFSVVLVCLSLLCVSSESQKPNYLYHICENTSTYATNSLFQTNLNFLLSSLSSYMAHNNTVNNGNSTDFNNVSRSASYTTTPHYSLHNVTPDLVILDNGFVYASAGLEPTDKAYIQSFCRGDLSPDVCQHCKDFAATDISKRCPNQKGGIIWYDECLLRYSNQSFFSTMVTWPAVYLWNTNNLSQPDLFNNLLAATMNYIATQATNSLQRFATAEANFTAFQNLYSLVQCTPDISSEDCDLCLHGAIAQLPTCCNGKQGARVLSPSCNVQYEIYPFYYTDRAGPVAPEPASIILPPPPPMKRKSRFSSARVVAVVAPTVMFLLLFGITSYCLLIRRARKKNSATLEETDVEVVTTMESLQFDFGAIETATNKFSDVNKLGEGGFGKVYKGILSSGQQIAVKRLSRSSEEGLEEFKNEVELVAKLQHRNLVRLLGFCWEADEQILVYEFVPNRSLDYFLHGPEKQGQLGWSTRYKIIEGIARGIVYLHHDSLLTIIHRDLKASNILLDKDMIPKISDFGVARIFEDNQAQANTDRIVGTHGYMSPEYAMHGHFSAKSDVYSFGVLTLEIISGMKNCGFHDQTNGAAEDLQNYAWNHWREGTALELLDPTLKACNSINEVIRCVHIALLCVQEDPVDRPTTATVVLMLNNESVTLPPPKQPALHNKEAHNSISLSLDDSLITQVYPR